MGDPNQMRDLSLENAPGGGGTGGAPEQPTAHPYETIAVVGAGAWGTALAVIAARAGRAVRLWGRNETQVAEIATAGENRAKLPGCPIPSNVRPTGDLAEALAGADAVLLVTPSRTIREMCRQIAAHIEDGVPVTLCSKGIEVGSGLLMSAVAEEELTGHPVGALSGPTFADETALGHPTAATIAFPFDYRARLDPTEAPAVRLAVSLGSETFRPYVSNDVIGVEIGGAVKNVIAIACGMMKGAGHGENTRAAVITRGLHEMKMLALKLHAQPETVTGLAGAGDLTLTCSSEQSRNMRLGLQLGRGIARADCFDGQPVVVEGEVNALSVTDLADRLGVDMPICQAVRRVLHEGADLHQAFAEIWASPLEGEPRALDIEVDHPAEESVAAAGAQVGATT